MPERERKKVKIRREFMPFQSSIENYENMTHVVELLLEGEELVCYYFSSHNFIGSL